jgi:hypothetical protein
MPEYRAYIIGADGHFIDAVELVCEDGAAANMQAEKLSAPPVTTSNYGRANAWWAVSHANGSPADNS